MGTVLRGLEEMRGVMSELRQEEVPSPLRLGRGRRDG